MRNEEFGFQRITVERPLRRRWEVTDDTLAAVETDKVIAKLDDETRAVLLGSLSALRGTPETNEKAFVKRVVEATGALDAKVKKAVVSACAIPDPDAPIITKKDGSPEPDADLRDAENVPLPHGYLELDEDERAKVLVESAEQYLNGEVLPYVPDAWIDHSKTKIGYEIPFTRQFYVYTPPRPVAEIDAELIALEEQIQEWMKGLVR
jgi:type I restriction enzyme M protein